MKEATYIKPRMSEQEEDCAAEFKVSYTPIKSGVYKIEIDSVILSVSQFSLAVSILDNAEETDQIVILLQSPGGNVDAADSLIHAMRKCKAPIHIIATGGCHSAATMILLEADSFELSSGFNALCHGGMNGAYGNVGEYYIKSDFDKKFRIEQFKDAYKGFLTESEIDRMLEGRDIWLDAEGWLQRADARHEYFKKNAEEHNKPKRKPRKKAPVAE
jgi:ATP-dependent protease ClpP protease subunit